MIPDTGEEETQLLRDVQHKSLPVRLKTYFRLSGPGFLQSAFALGGGSMASSLYLGVLTGYSMLWTRGGILGLGVLVIFLAAVGIAEWIKKKKDSN